MISLKNLTPYFITILLIIFLLQVLNSTKNNFVNNIIKEIEYLLPKEKNSQENKYTEIDYSIFSDDMICDKVPHIDFYPELSGFKDEANRRGIKCYYKTVGFYSTNNSTGFVPNIELPVARP